MTRIRPAESEDLSSLVGLLKTLFSIEEDFCFDETLQRRGLEMMLANPQGCVLVAERHKEVVGMCSGQLLISTAQGGPVALIEDVVISKINRNRGIGILLMEEMSTWAQAQKASRLQLLADKKNKRALQFYKKIGWQNTQLICLRKFI